jgi:hypothetical protein
MADTEMHIEFSWEGMKEGDRFDGVHVFEKITLKLRRQ